MQSTTIQIAGTAPALQALAPLELRPRSADTCKSAAPAPDPRQQRRSRKQGKASGGSAVAGAATRPKPPQQPLHAAQLEDALLKIQTVRALTGLSDATIYRRIAADTFPHPIRLGTRCTRWRAGDVTAWLRQQAANA
jgi:prophage regulatory protein